MHSRVRLAFVVLLLAVLLLVPAATTAADSAQVMAGDMPAVEAPAEEADEEEDPWTARFLAPTVMLLGVVALVGSIGYYAVCVRGKYRIGQ